MFQFLIQSLAFFPQFKQEKKIQFLPTFFPSHFFFPLTFLSIKLSKDQTKPKEAQES